MRASVRKLLTESGEDEVVGEASNGGEAVELILHHCPDLVVLDLNLQGIDGVDVAREVRRVQSVTKFLALSSYPDERAVVGLGAGLASGFVDKNADTIVELTKAVAAIRHGESYFSAAFIDVKKTLKRNPISHDKILSGRECEILRLIGRSCSDDYIAKLLLLSEKTVKTHRARIMAALDLHSTPKLMQYAQRIGLSRTAR